MALNAIDGMMARELHMSTQLGAVLNELGDAVSDLGLYLPLAFFYEAASWPVVAFAIGGVLTEESWTEFISVLAHEINMTPAYEPQVWNFPHEDKGGTGILAVQPIVQSFIVADTWPINNGAYLHICSCKPFDPEPVLALARKYGMEPAGSFLTGLELPR